MKNFRLYIGAGREATGAGCILALLSVALTIGVCLVVGAWFFDWAHFPRLGRRDFGLLVYGALILPGVLLFLVGAALLSRLGIPVMSEVDADDQGRKDVESEFR